MAVARYDILRWCLKWLATPPSTPVVDPTVPGVEYYAPDQRKHYTVPDTRLHYQSEGTD